MAHYRHLPVWKAALDLAVHLEHAVRRFPRYHKYTLGSELRQTAQRLCRWVARANNANAEGRFAALDQLVLTQKMQAFANFNEFAQATELAVALGKQSGGWRRRVRPEASAHSG
jgi:lipid-binding SYLF domain-containing protein